MVLLLLGRMQATILVLRLKLHMRRRLVAAEGHRSKWPTSAARARFMMVAVCARQGAGLPIDGSFLGRRMTPFARLSLKACDADRIVSPMLPGERAVPLLSWPAAG